MTYFKCIYILKKENRKGVFVILINKRALGTNVDGSPTRLLLSSKNMYTNTIPDCHPYPKYGATHFTKVATVPLQVCTACNKRHAERGMRLVIPITFSSCGALNSP